MMVLSLHFGEMNSFVDFQAFFGQRRELSCLSVCFSGALLLKSTKNKDTDP